MRIESLVEEVKKIAEKHETLANPIRVQILSIIAALEEASWSEIKAILQNIYGEINPNTLAFHLKKLIDHGLILKSGSPEFPSYIANIPENLREELKEIIKFYKKFMEESRR